jgi:hypothetical protein
MVDLICLDGWNHTELAEIRHRNRSGLITVCPHDVQLGSADHDLLTKRNDAIKGIRCSGTGWVFDKSKADREHVERVKREKP